MSVGDAVNRDLANLATRKPELASGTLAETMRALARKLDGDKITPTAAAFCARALIDCESKLQERTPAEDQTDRLDDLARKRAARKAR